MPAATAAAQTVLLGPHAAAASQALQLLSAEHFLDRLWAQDPGLWGGDPAMQDAIRQRLGWLTITPVMSRQAAALRRFADEVRQAGLTRAVLLGMGGSSLFTEVCASLFGGAEGSLPVSIIDTTDPSAIRSYESQDALERLCVIAASKSGTTLETKVLLRYFYGALKRVSRNPGAQCLAITDCGTPLEHEAGSLKFRKVFTHGAGAGLEVGGRFSALTFFGLVPAALMGIDPVRLLQRADAMQARCAPGSDPAQNPGLQLGAALGALAASGRNKLTLLTSPQTSGIGPWIEQLIAESTGKQSRGIVPVHGEARRSPADYGADRVFIELQSGPRADAELESLADRLIAGGRPVIRIRWQDSYDVGGEAMKWFIATAVVGRLLGVNPLDEPDVQTAKDHTQSVLRQFMRDQSWPDGHLIGADDHVAAYGEGSGDMKRFLAAFFLPKAPCDYLALLSFLPRTAALDQQLSQLRDRLGARLGCATLLQSGPRYLHSTGQLFKGGTPEGRFLVLTGEEPDDLAIPGESYTFGQLKRAQALGDAAAMLQKGRRVLRLHLRGDLDTALGQVARLLEQAVS